MVVLPIAWAKRRWALPFLTILAPSRRSNEKRGRRHKPLPRWAIQAALQTRRWLPGRHGLPPPGTTGNGKHILPADARAISRRL